MSGREFFSNPISSQPPEPYKIFWNKISAKFISYFFPFIVHITDISYRCDFLTSDFPFKN